MAVLGWLVFMMVSYANAKDTLELVGPGITWHVIDGGASSQYNHKLSSDGRLIYTPQIGIKKTRIEAMQYNSFAIFTAQNSIGSPIVGAMGATGIELFNMFQVGFVLGGYVQNNNDFKAMGITPFSIMDGPNALVPIMGIDLNFKYKISDLLFVGFNNILTPVITNSNLSIGLEY